MDKYYGRGIEGGEEQKQATGQTIWKKNICFAHDSALAQGSKVSSKRKGNSVFSGVKHRQTVPENKPKE